MSSSSLWLHWFQSPETQYGLSEGARPQHSDLAIQVPSHFLYPELQLHPVFMVWVPEQSVQDDVVKLLFAGLVVIRSLQSGKEQFALQFE